MTDVDVKVFVASDREPDEQLLARLARAVEQVDAQLGSEGNEHQWSAIIGHPAERIGGTEKRLEAPVSVGNLNLESAGAIFSEPDISHQPSISG